MYRLWRRVKREHRSPSAILGLSEAGIWDTVCWDFDQAVYDWGDWYEEQAEARVVGPIGEQPDRGETWVPKYGTVDAILAEYDGRPALVGPALDPAAQAVMEDRDGFLATIETIASRIADQGEVLF